MKDQASKRYLWVTVFNITITAAEIAGGIISGSLALLSDALHNLSDVVSIVVAFAANLVAKRSKDQHKTFGYKRAETLAAYTNGLFLLALFLNMMSDTLSSVAVVVGSLLIYYQNWTLVDPVLTMAAAIFLLKEAFEVTRDSANVLMEANPDLDLEAIEEAGLAFKEVRQLHHLHVWRYSDDTIMLDAHIVVDSDLTAKRIEELDEEIAACLKEKFAINHVTLQAECSRGLDEDLLSTNKEN